MAVVIFGHLYLSYVGHHSFAHERKRFAFFATSAFSSAMASSESEEETSVAQWLRLLVSPTMVATLLLVLAVGVCALVGFSRVYSASRFPHQIAASYVTGLVGLLLSRHCCEHMAFHKYVDRCPCDSCCAEPRRLTRLTRDCFVGCATSNTTAA